MVHLVKEGLARNSLFSNYLMLIMIHWPLFLDIEKGIMIVIMKNILKPLITSVTTA